jgi:hypothetical protein
MEPYARPSPTRSIPLGNPRRRRRLGLDNRGKNRHRVQYRAPLRSVDANLLRRDVFTATFALDLATARLLPLAAIAQGLMMLAAVRLPGDGCRLSVLASMRMVPAASKHCVHEYRGSGHTGNKCLHREGRRRYRRLPAIFALIGDSVKSTRMITRAIQRLEMRTLVGVAVVCAAYHGGMTDKFSLPEVCAANRHRWQSAVVSPVVPQPKKLFSARWQSR